VKRIAVQQHFTLYSRCSPLEGNSASALPKWGQAEPHVGQQRVPDSVVGEVPRNALRSADVPMGITRDYPPSEEFSEERERLRRDSEEVVASSVRRCTDSDVLGSVERLAVRCRVRLSMSFRSSRSARSA
jgi:hypothetical protein